MKGAQKAQQQVLCCTTGATGATRATGTSTFRQNEYAVLRARAVGWKKTAEFWKNLNGIFQKGVHFWSKNVPKELYIYAFQGSVVHIRGQ